MKDVLEKFRELDDSKAEAKQTILIYKKVFLTEEGQFALARILERCKFLDHCENEQDMALNNFAKDLILTVYWDIHNNKPDTNRVIQFIKRKLLRIKK